MSNLQLVDDSLSVVAHILQPEVQFWNSAMIDILRSNNIYIYIYKYLNIFIAEEENTIGEYGQELIEDKTIVKDYVVERNICHVQNCQEKKKHNM